MDAAANDLARAWDANRQGLVTEHAHSYIGVLMLLLQDGLVLCLSAEL